MKKKACNKLNNIVISILIAVLIFVVYRLIFPVYGISQEDYCMRSIVTGRGMSGDTHIVFSSTILGTIAKFLYSLFDIKCWEYMQIGLILLAFIDLNLLIIKKNDLNSVLVMTLINVVLGLRLYTLIDYKTTAMFVGCVGLSNIALGNKEQHTWIWIAENIVGIIFSAFSALYSWRISIVCVLFILPVFIGNIERQSQKKRNIINRVVWIVPYLLILIGVSVSQSVYYSDGKWEQWQEYYEAYSDIQEHGVPDWEEYKEAYEELGLSENDVLILASNIAQDENVFQEDVIVKISQIRGYDENVLDNEFWQSFLEGMIYGSFAIMVVGTFIIYFWTATRKDIKYLLYSLILCATLMAFGYIQGGMILMQQAYYAVVIGEVIFLMDSIEFVKLHRKDGINSVVKCLSVSVLALCLIYNYMDTTASEVLSDEQKIVFSEIMEELSADETRVYCLYENNLYNYLLTTDIELPDNVWILDESIKNLPNKKQIDLQDLYKQKDVYFVTGNDLMVWTMYNYLNEHTTDRVDVLCVEEALNYKVIKYTVNE